MKYDKTLAISTAIIAVATLIVLGFTGLRAILGSIVIMMLPIYLILNKTSLDPLEKTIFSIFLGVGIVPGLVYWPSTIISLRITVALVFLLLMVIAFVIKSKPNNNQH